MKRVSERTRRVDNVAVRGEARGQAASGHTFPRTESIDTNADATPKTASAAMARDGYMSTTGSSSRGDRQAQIRATVVGRRSERPPTRISFARATIRGASAPLLIPVGDTQTGNPLERLIARARDLGGWREDQRRELALLATLARTADITDFPLPDRHCTKSTIAVSLSEPGQITRQYGSATAAFVRKIEARDGVALLLPPRLDLLFPDEKNVCDLVLRSLVVPLDGLVGAGGNDVHPRMYLERPRYAEDTHYPRDKFEADLFRYARQHGLCAFFAVCRSHQLWNVALGGRLVQDMVLEGHSKYSLRLKNRGDITRPFEVRGEDGSVIYRAMIKLALGERSRAAASDKTPLMASASLHPGREAGEREALDGQTSHNDVRTILANSNRHQAVSSPGQGMQTIGWFADRPRETSTAEATQFPGGRTVQWHPEHLDDVPSNRLFDGFMFQAAMCRIAKRQLEEGEQVDPARIREEIGPGLSSDPAFLPGPEDEQWLTQQAARYADRELTR